MVVISASTAREIRCSSSSAITDKRKSNSGGVEVKRTSCTIANGWNRRGKKRRQMTVKIGPCSHTSGGVGSKRCNSNVVVDDAMKKNGGGSR